MCMVVAAIGRVLVRGAGAGFVGRVLVAMVVVVVVAVVRMVMVVPMPVVVPAVIAIGTRLGFERFVHRVHDQVHAAQHVGQHMVGLDLQVIGLELDRHVAVAQVVGGPHQVEGTAVAAAGGDAQHGLGGRDHAHQRAILGHQHVAAAHRGAAGQEHAQVAPTRVGGIESAFLAHVPVQFKGVGALEQHGRQALATGDDFGDLQHGRQSRQENENGGRNFNASAPALSAWGQNRK